MQERAELKVTEPLRQSRGLSPIAFTMLEVCLWLTFFLVITGRVWFTALDGAPIDYIVSKYYFDVLLGLVVLIFPFLFILIFGKYPLAQLRHLRSKKERRDGIQHASTTLPVTEFAIDVEQEREQLQTNLESKSAEDLLKNLAYSSRKISEGIYTRAGVYLLIGVLIAFSGLVFFYTQSSRLSDIHDPTSLLLNLVPRFGILFFIELIAFFFLRQYRIAMDEFRYFEAIKRNREETLALIRLAKQQNNDLNVQDLLAKCMFYSSAGKLGAGETTELLESRKLDKNELEILDKVVDVLSKSTPPQAVGL